LAALAVLTVLGIDLNYCIEQMANVKLIRSHLELHKGYNNSTIIDDTWSSNPTSMKAALEVLKEKGKNKVKILVLGKISYLGDFAKEYQEQIGKLIYESKIDFIVSTDSYSKTIAQNAISQGMKPEYHLHCKNNEELKSYLECLMDINSIVLFKTSMLEQSITKIVNELIEDEKK
jgi:UDP-N-acetylmuramoyl-tripeptide--D-alanyl-D-alanine ligase